MILYFILSPLLLSPQVSAVSPPQTDHTSTNFSVTRHSNLEFSCSFVVMTMHSFSHILDLCLLLLMIFRLLGQSILLFTATDIIKQCPCTSDSIIFFCSLHTNFSPNSGQVGVSTSHLLLMRLSPHTSPKLRFAGLQLCLALQSSHCHHRFTSLPAVGTALLPAVGCALASRVLGSLPWLFLFTDSWVPTLAVFFWIITQTFTIDCNTKSLSSTVRHNS